MSTETASNTRRLKVWVDHDPMNPREWDNVGTMAFHHGRYTLGDKDHGLTPDDVIDVTNSPSHFAMWVYMYDHSGITISTEPFSCLFDSGPLGIIFGEKHKLCKEFEKDKWTKELQDRVCRVFIDEVALYDKYLRGEVYGFTVQELVNGEWEDTDDECGGFYGDRWLSNGMLEHVPDDLKDDTQWHFES